MPQPAADPPADAVASAGSPRLAALLADVQDLGEAVDLGAFLRHLVSVAARVSGARFAALGVLDPSEPGRLARFITHGLDAAHVAAIERLPTGRGLLGRLIRDPLPVRLTDLTQAPDAVGFPPGHPPMHTFLGVPVRAGGRVFGNLYLTQKDGGRPFDADDERLVQGLAGVAGSVIEARQERALALAQAQVLGAVTRIHEDTRVGVDLDTVLPVITEAALALTGGSATAVVGAGSDGELLVRAASGAPSGPVLVGLSGPVRRALDTQERVEVLPRHRSVRLDATPSEHRTTLHPVVTDSGEGAVLVAADWAPAEGQSAEQIEDLLDIVAVEASVVLDRGTAERDRALLALLTDRDRIAQDLHDLVIQRLFATGLQLQGAARFTDEEVMVERLTSAVSELDATIRDIRATIFALQRRPDEGSLRDDVRALVTGYATTLGFSPTTRLYGPLDTVLDDDLQLQLLAVLREALSNVARHAMATSAVVEVGVEAGGDPQLTARVVDDGVGIDSAGRGSGLRNLRARAHTRGGVLDLVPRQPRGTMLTWRIPLDPLRVDTGAGDRRR